MMATTNSEDYKDNDADDGNREITLSDKVVSIILVTIAILLFYCVLGSPI